MELYILNNITKEYGKETSLVYALDNISVELKQGDFIVIVGASGSGKSTLLNLLGGIDKVTTGEILFKDEDITKLSNGELTDFRRDNIGFIFQHYNLLNNLTALENVEFTCEMSKIDKNKAMEAIERVDLAKRCHHYPSEMSGGEQQRISIARAIVKEPPVLLCDEPTGALDAKTGALVLNILKDINIKNSTTVIVVTHNKDITRIADYIITMKDGKIIEAIENPHPESPEDIQW